MEVRIIDMISLSSDGIKNEDKAGVRIAKQAGFAWMIDGATGVNNSKHISECLTDATWYAEELNEIFYTLNNDVNVETMAATSIQKIAAAYAKKTEYVREIPKMELPSAAVFWMKWLHDEFTPSLYHINMGWLGDCVAIIEYKNKIFTYGNEVSGFSHDDIISLFQNVKLEAAHSIELQKTLLDTAIEEERMRMNKKNGYWIFSTDTEAAENLCKNKLTCDSPVRVLLATDGFYRLVDLYKRYTDEELIHTCKNKGLNYLAKELRMIELQDSLHEKYPRFKISDDATALLFELFPE